MDYENASKFRKFAFSAINGKPIGCYVDSGNTAGNCISLAACKYLQLTRQMQTVHSVHLSTAKAGAELAVVGKIPEVDLSFPEADPPLQPFRTSLLVIKGLSMPFNLAGPFLKDKEIDQLHSTSELLCRGSRIALYRTDPVRQDTVSYSNLLMPIQVGHQYEVFSYVRRQKIPSQHASIVRVVLADEQPLNGRGSTAVFEFGDDFLEKYGLKEGSESETYPQQKNQLVRIDSRKNFKPGPSGSRTHHL